MNGFDNWIKDEVKYGFNKRNTMDGEIINHKCVDYGKKYGWYIRCEACSRVGTCKYLSEGK